MNADWLIKEAGGGIARGRARSPSAPCGRLGEASLPYRRQTFIRALPLLILIVASGCASTSAPDGWLPTPPQAQIQAFGGWTEVSLAQTEGQRITVQGELIAIEVDSAYVLTRERLRAIARSDIVEIRLVGYDIAYRPLAVWTTLGTLSTASHGLGVIFSVPIWLLGGIESTVHQSYQPIFSSHSDEWRDLHAFARFPQGLPADIEPSRLRPKPFSLMRDNDE